MTTRANVITTLTTLLDGLDLGNGVTLNTTNTFFEPLDDDTKLPKIWIIPDPETIVISLSGTNLDRTMRVGLAGFCYVDDSATLFLEVESYIEAIIAKLQDPASVTTNCQAGFSITEMGPVISEQSEEQDNLAYFSIPQTVIYFADA